MHSKKKNIVLYLVNCHIKSPASDMYLIFSEGVFLILSHVAFQKLLNTAGIHEGLLIQSEEAGSSFCNDKIKQCFLYVSKQKPLCICFFLIHTIYFMVYFQFLTTFQLQHWHSVTEMGMYDLMNCIILCAWS